MPARKQVSLKPISAHALLFMFQERQFDDLRHNRVDFGEISTVEDSFLKFIGHQWNIKPLPGGSNNPCSMCSYMYAIFGVLVPFVNDLCHTHDEAQVRVTDSGILFSDFSGEIMAIDEFGIWCTDGKSFNLHARLKVKLRTTDGKWDEHTWENQIPSHRWWGLEQVLLVPEVGDVLSNARYPEVVRDILSLLMDRLCVSAKKLTDATDKTAQQARQAGTLLIDIP